VTVKTHPIFTNDGGNPFAFELESIYISPLTSARLLAEVDGVTDIVPRRMFSKLSDIHLQFKYRGKPYILLEPYGDNSRYWIGPKHGVNDVGDITALEAVFKHYRPSFHRAVLGDVLTLRFVTRFFRRDNEQ
jgi:hypothetical protein